MRLWIGIVTFLFGVSLWYRTQRQASPAPQWQGRLGLGCAALGLSTLSMTQQGLSWTISSICFSIVAITFLGWVVADIVRRRDR